MPLIRHEFILFDDETRLEDTSFADVLTTFVEITANTKQHIFCTDEPLPLVGSWAVKADETKFPVKGFLYDRRRYIDEDDESTFNNTTIGGLTNKTLDGTVLEHWKSGIGSGDDCDVVDIVRNPHFGITEWSPRVFRGEYFSHHQGFYLFPDGHVEHPLITDFISRDLETEPVRLSYTPSSDSPVVAGIYRRESGKEALPYRVFDLVESFTGLLEDNEREETIDENGIPDYDLIDSFTRWEIYLNTKTNDLYFNRDPTFLVGSIDSSVVASLDNKADILELLGVSDGTGGQIFFTKYFPIDPGTRGSTRTERHILLVESNGNSEVWEVAEDNDLSFHDSDDKVYHIDYDLGIVGFGGLEVEDRYFISGEVDSSTDEIPIYNSTDGLPERGVVEIDDEIIKYAGKTETKLVQCTRGFRNTVASSHTIYSEVDYLPAGAIPPTDSNIYVGYYTTPRIEYTVDKWEDKVVADDIDARPVTVPEGNGIVYISRRPLILDHIDLTVNKDLIEAGVYGLLFAGSDYAILTAIALSSSDEPVPRVQLTIEQISDPPFIGLFNGTISDYKALTNYDGEISASYVIGNDADKLLVSVDSMSVSGSQTTMVISGDHSSVEAEDVFLFVVTKDDPVVGTVGVLATYETGTYSESSNLPGAVAQLSVTTMRDFTSVVIGDIYPDGAFDDGTITVYTTSGTAYETTIVHWRNSTCHLSTTLPIVDSDIDFVVLMKEDWIEWNVANLNGRKRVIYEFLSTAVNPVTGNLGAYYPLQPIDIDYDGTSTTFTFDRALALMDADDIENNVGGYVMNLPVDVTFRAKGIDPFTGRTIYSNSLTIRLDLPDYLKGIYLSGSDRIPYGFRIRDDTIDAASGLDGACFVSINPISGSSGAIANPFAGFIHLISI